MAKLILVNNWLNPQQDSDKAWMKTEVMIEANTTNSASYANFSNDIGNDQFRLREAFVSTGNLSKASREPSSGRAKDIIGVNTSRSMISIRWT